MKLNRIKNLMPAPKDARGLYLVVSPEKLLLSESGSFKGSEGQISVEVWKRKGDDDPTQEDMGEYSVYIFKNGSTTVSALKKNTPSFTYAASKNDTAIDIKLKVKDSFVDAKTVTVTSDGKLGGNTATVFLFRRSASAISAIDWSATLTYTFATQRLDSVPTGWTLNKIPSGTDPIYVTAATAYGTGAADTIDASEWATPVLFVENGKNALSSAPVFLFKRSASKPGKPTATLTYTFATGKLSGTLEGWSQSIPATDGNPCWVIQATAVGTGDTDTIGPGEWSDQQEYVRDGDPGPEGDDGNSVTGHYTYYLATTMATGVTRNTDASSWTTSYQTATADKPYVWRYEKTTYSKTSPSYTDCELIFSYSAGANPNLLEQTNFSSLQALDKWTVRNVLVLKQGVTVSAESYAAVTTGIQAHNAYYDRTDKTTAQIYYKEVLEQMLWTADGKIRKIEPDTWYTLSFWAKGASVYTVIPPGAYNPDSACYIDGVLQPAGSFVGSALIKWSLSGEWKRHTFTFRSESSFDGDKWLLFRIYPSVFTSEVYICMPKLEVGMQATGYLSNEEATHFGQPRNRRWALNTQYLAGGVDEQYDDTVLFGESDFFHCVKSHISTLANSPIGADGGLYWKAMSKIESLATDIFFAEKALINNLIATIIQTGYSGSPHIEAEGSEFKIFGKGQYPAVYLAVNDDNRAVLRFQDENTGEFLYDLGPDGIMKEFSEVQNSYTEIRLKRLYSVTRVAELLDIATADCTRFYRFNEGYKQIGTGSSATRKYNVSGTSRPSSKNSRYFTSQSYNGTQIADGWYVGPNNGKYMAQAAADAVVGSPAVSVYVVRIFHFSDGLLVGSVPVYFRQTDSQYAAGSVGCDEQGNELSTSTYTYLYSYWQQNNITL